MADDVRNVLFLCTGNSARSILAEVILDHWSKGLFKGHSAGSHPKGAVHPMALRLLDQLGMPTEGLRSKSWNEFTTPGAPRMDYVFTVCDQAASENCLVWPGLPIGAHWGIPDPAAAQGSDAECMATFREAFRMLEMRIRYFLALRFQELGREELQEVLNAVGKAGGGPISLAAMGSAPLSASALGRDG